MWFLLAAALAATTRVSPSIEPLGTADDRTATRLEDQIKANPAPWLACWIEHGEGRDGVTRFVGFRVKMNNVTGAPKRSTLTFPSGSPELDSCVGALISGMTLSPPSVFPDKLDIGLTFPVDPPAEPSSQPSPQPR
jgi:hypothetical protein